MELALPIIMATLGLFAGSVVVQPGCCLLNRPSGEWTWFLVGLYIYAIVSGLKAHPHTADFGGQEKRRSLGRRVRVSVWMGALPRATERWWRELKVAPTSYWAIALWVL